MASAKSKITGKSVEGLVVAAFGRRFLVRDPDGSENQVVTRGRNADITVGDRVIVSLLQNDERIIERRHTRKNQLQRSALHRTKILAANLDQAALIIAPSPRYSDEIALRIMLSAQAADIPLIIIANKSEIDAFESIAERLAVFEKIGVQVMRVSALSDPADTQRQFASVLANRTTLLLGESGMGKSTILNILVPDAKHRTNEISVALGTGKHTTSFSRMFQLDPSICANARLIDSPGFQQFGLAHLSESEMDHAMPEFRPWLGKCRFHNCRHLNEPGCKITEAVKNGEIDSLRYRLLSGIRG